MANNVKRQVRDAAIALLQGNTSAKTVEVYANRAVNVDELPAILVSTAIERNDIGISNTAQPLLVSLILRFVGMTSTLADDNANVVDVLDNLEQEATALLDNSGDPNNDPLGIGAMMVYWDNSEEPELDDEHQELVAVIETTYGVQLRVNRDDLTAIV